MKEKNSYEGWIISDNLLKRSFAIFGHFLIAYMIISLFSVILFLVFFY